ncbi:hypothetical protein M3765_13160 [Streptomyces thermoviolaceus]|jgi:hypothetical protein|uniref:Uncharacterized protein n=1 Tax=Streptomyces thermoviolaceus subsp. thermoviolaceus TaxID=66860 RepID=A0ABX0YS88_STRTL|nr:MULTISPECIES: hypothetical protein [Streptomyces]MCM3264961.1 hypothetical protein [Streptomyces thermoviolaceus]NJP15234.1 hypothetical protein [Streptomyces thermoviolaceus subsp. thermoviolaceus]WTD46047.1 hypothetical protein OG899_00060 [Streptomyces thermoviolaceus]GGV76731.1 hypothetical protein GCM10010499_34980 [Streptomyces thermoviolaceus subsp. apingens]GHA74102.1 hypothetical protein GCM10010512_00230 [Streptomyces thermoviolaceus subsp. thermoviolaceus]
MPRSRTSASGLRATADFLLYERLNALGWNVPLPVFRLLCLAGSAAMVPVLLTVALLGAHLLRRTTELPGAVLAGGFLVLNLYGGGVYLLREAFSRRRHTVSGSPNEGFYRALDIRARDVFLVYCAARILSFHSALLTVDAAFLFVFRDVLAGSVTLGLICVPLALCAVTLAVSARLAVRAGTAVTVGPGVFAALGLVVFVTGLAAGMLPDAGASGVGVSCGTGVVGPLALAVTVACAGLTVAALRCFARDVRRLDRDAFAIRPSVRSAALPAMVFRPGRLPLLAVLHRHFVSSRTAVMIKRTYAVLLMAVLLLAGVRVSGSEVLPLPGGAERPVTRTAVALGFVLLLGSVELVLATSGPTALGPQFRFAWENLLSHRHIAVSAALYCNAHAVVLAAGVAAVAGLLNGTVPWHLPFLGLGVMSASLIAESLASVPKRLVDGTSAPGVFVACVSIGLALPALAGSTAHLLFLRLLAAFYSVCLFTGAITCIGRRIRTLPSRSAR